MGDVLYEMLVPRKSSVACRVYAPVGSHRDLLAYLVRRLLENGANTSFVHQVADSTVPLERLAADPLALLPDPLRAEPARAAAAASLFRPPEFARRRSLRPRCCSGWSAGSPRTGRQPRRLA